MRRGSAAKWTINDTQSPSFYLTIIEWHQVSMGENVTQPGIANPATPSCSKAELIRYWPGLQCSQQLWLP